MTGLGDQVRRSLGVYAIGKLVSAVCAVALLLLLARQLPTSDYALFITLQGLILIVGAVTSFGINQALLRYLPELMAAGQRRTMYGLLWRSLATRTAVTVGTFGLLALALPWLPAGWGLQASVGVLWIYFAVGAVRLVGYFLVRSLEAMLWQRLAQLSMAAAALLRLVVVLALWSSGHLSLTTLAWAELAVDIALLLALVLGLAWRQRRDGDASAGEAHVHRSQRDRMRHYGRWNYLSTLASQLATSSPYRLLSGALFAGDQTAVLGFAISLVDLVQRFLPINLGRILIRSVVVAQATTGRTMVDIARQLNLSLRVSTALVGLLVAGFAAAGTAAADWLSAGRYAASGPLVAGLGVVLALDVLRLHHELLAELAERPIVCLRANAALVVGVLLAVLLAPWLGVWCVVAGALVGQAASILVFRRHLADLPLGALADRRLLGMAAATLAGGFAGMLPVGHWTLILALGLAITVVVQAALRTLHLSELHVLRRRPKARPSP